MENEKFQELVLEHLARLTQELTEVNSKISGLESMADHLQTDISGLKTDMDQVKDATVRIENEHGGKINALFDAREVLHDQIQRILESQNRMEIKLDRMSLKVSAHEVELRKAK